MPILSAQQKLRLIRRAYQGEKVARLCREAGISRKTFYQWLKKIGPIRPQLKPLLLTDKRIKRLPPVKPLTLQAMSILIKKAANRESSISELCREAGISRKTFYKWQARLNQDNQLSLVALSDQRPTVVHHPRYIGSKKEKMPLLSAQQKIELIRRAQQGEKVAPICREAGISRKTFYQWLKKTNGVRPQLKPLLLTDGRTKQLLLPKPFTPQQRFTLINRVINKERSVFGLCREVGISRKTFYKWRTRLNQSDQFPLVALEDQRPRGENHPRYLGSGKEELVLDYVVKNPAHSCRLIANALPEIGYHGIQNVLERNNLNTCNRRLAYQQSRQPIAKPTFAPIPTSPRAFGSAKILRFLIAPFVTVPKLAFSSSVPRAFITTFLLSFLSFIATFQSSNFLAQTTPIQRIGLFFALVSLTFGFFFFLYSLKYYFTLMIILGFSRQVSSSSENGGNNGGGNSNKGSHKKLSGGFANYQLNSNSASGGNGSFWRKIFGGNENGNGYPGLGGAGGLQPDLSHIELQRKPFVSIHLALYNEKRVVERLLTVCTSMDYENYEIVVVDDSTDETIEILNKWVPHPRVKIIHREKREGYKGGALQVALENTNPQAEFVLVFDADFVPYPDSITQFLKYFQATAGSLDFSHLSLDSNTSKATNDQRPMTNDCPIAAVQGYQWHVLNKSENWITRGVRSEYAGSYVVERSGGEILGSLKQIAGSVYMIRKDVLSKYGWGVSITEDFELTLKLYRDGYKVVYTPYIQAPSECVSTIKRLIRQRMRWAEGHSYNIKKMFWQLLTSRKLSFREKIEFLYLSPYYLQACFFMVGTLAWFISEAVFKTRLPFWTSLWGWSLVLTNLFALPLMNTVGLFLEEAEEKDYAGIISFVLLSYLVVPFQGYAALKGFLEKEEGPWFRTPKTGKITDIFTPGRFYRFIFGIFGGRPATAPITADIGAFQRRADERGFGVNPYLALATANNRFNDFKLRPRRIRWAGKSVLAVFLIIVMFLNYLTFFVPPTRASDRISGQTAATVEQQINIIDQEYSVSPNNCAEEWPGDNSLGIIHWDGTKYANETVYFEAVAKTTMGYTQRIGLWPVGGSAAVTTLSTDSTSYVRLRSGAISLTNGTDYTVRMSTCPGATPYIKAARLIVVQSGTTNPTTGLITDTETQVEIGNNETTTSSSYGQLTNKKMYYYDSSKFSPAPTVNFEASLQASGQKIEQQINIIDQSSSTTATTWSAPDGSLGYVNIDLSKYSGASFYFEAVLKCNSSGSSCAQARLYRGGTMIYGSGATTSSTSWTRVRSAEITAEFKSEAYSEFYSVAIMTTSGKTAYIQSARIIIIQDGVADTQTQVEVGNKQTGFTGQGYSALTDYKIYKYDQNQFNPTPESSGDVELHATLSVTSSVLDDVCAELYNNTDSQSVVEVCLTGADYLNYWYFRTATNVDGDADWDTTNDDQYIIRVKCVDNNGAGCSGSISNAKIALTQSQASGITKLETLQEYNNTLATDNDSTYTSQSFPNSFDKSSFSNTTVAAYFESALKTSSGADAYFAQLDYSGGLGQVTASDTSYTLNRNGSDLWSSLPASATNVDVQLKNNSTSTTSSSSSWLVLQISISSVYTAYAELYECNDAGCDGTGDSSVSNSEVSVVSGWTRKRTGSAITLTSGKYYTVRIKEANGGTAKIATAKLILDQTNAGGVSAFETFQEYNNTLATDTDSTYTSQTYLNYFGRENWSGAAFAAFFESTLKTGNGSNAYFARLDYNSGTGQVTAADTSYTLKRSGNIWSSLPSSAAQSTNIDVQLKNASTSTTSSSNSWLVIQVSSLQSGASIEQQINIIDQTVSTTSTTDTPTDNSLGLIHWTAGSYTGATVYFEALICNTGYDGGKDGWQSDTTTATLYTSGGSSVSGASASVSQGGCSYSRQRSASITLTDGTDYTVRYKTGSAGTAYLKAARLIIVQSVDSATWISNTETQVEVGQNGTTTSTSYVLPYGAGGPIYCYDTTATGTTCTSASPSVWNPTPTIKFEATLSNNTAGQVAYAALYSGSSCATQVSGSEVSVTGTSWALTRSSAITLTAGTEYYACIKAGANTARIANAKIILTQSNANGIPALETVQHYNNSYFGQGATWASSGWVNYYDPGNFLSGTFTKYFESSFHRNTSPPTDGSMRLYNVTSSSAITGSTVTDSTGSHDRYRSGDITSNMPTTAATMDAQGNNIDDYSAWLIIQVSSLQIPEKLLLLIPVILFLPKFVRWWRSRKKAKPIFTQPEQIRTNSISVCNKPQIHRREVLTNRSP